MDRRTHSLSGSGGLRRQGSPCSSHRGSLWSGTGVERTKCILHIDKEMLWCKQSNPMTPTGIFPENRYVRNQSLVSIK